MKIRTHFALLAVIVVFIPGVLFGLGLTFWSLTRGENTLPQYEQLPAGAEELTDQTTWEKVRGLLENRPGKSQTFIFNQEFQLIYASAPLLSERPGQPIVLQDAIQQLQAGGKRDVALFQPAETRLWIVIVQNADSGAAWSGVLWKVGMGLLIVLILSIALSLYLGRGLATSIVKLEAVAQKVAQGDLAFSVSLKGSDEVRSLGRALEQMRQALLEEDARQSRFVMGVSHDLKSPLALIKGYVELLKDGPKASAQARDAHFDLILDKVDQLDGMIDHLIDYSKVNTGDWQQTWRPVAMKGFLEEFCDGLVPDARLLGRTLRGKIALPEDWAVPCDARSIRRTLENLVHNALRYTESGGTVGVEAALVPGGAQITVWDDGPGLAAADLPHLFDPFYRGTHSRRESGMGLGLSIVKTILDSHGWTIRAESDQGARFVIDIPLPA